MHQDFLVLSEAGMKDAAHDFSPTAIQARAVQLKELQSRLRTISPSAWPVDQKVDWVLVRIELNDLDFRYRVIRPWSRDPSFYLDFFRTMPYADVPVPASKLNNFRIQLRSISGLVQLAEKNLTEAGGDLTDIAIFHLEHYDGVNQGEPIRNVLRMVSYVGMRTWSLASKSSSPSLHRMCSKRSALFANTTIGSLRIDLSLTIRARLASNRLSPLRRRNSKTHAISAPRQAPQLGFQVIP